MRERISKVLDRLEEAADMIGKPLLYTGGQLREIKLGSFRLYYTILRQEVLVLILELEHKDEQIKTIRRIMLRLKASLDRAKQKLGLHT